MRQLLARFGVCRMTMPLAQIRSDSTSSGLIPVLPILARHGGIENDFPDRCTFYTNRQTFKHTPVLESEQCPNQIVFQ
jgi:hypothetical protein